VRDISDELLLCLDALSQPPAGFLTVTVEVCNTNKATLDKSRSTENIKEQKE
jgi:hypothetical protein